MKRMMLYAGLCIAVVVGLCAFGAQALEQEQAAPVLTEQVEGTVLAINTTALIVQTESDAKTESAVQPQTALRKFTMAQEIAQELTVGCVIRLEAQLHPQSGETILAITVLEQGSTVDEAQARLAQKMLN